MDVRVRASGCFTDVDFSFHLSGRDEKETATRVLDLSRARFVDPFGLVVLAALAEDGVRSGMDVQFQAPVDVNCANYLHRMGLAEVLDGFCVPHTLGPVRRNDLGDRLFELRHFGVAADAADLLAEQIFRIFADEDPATARELYNSVSEMANNVIDHSGQAGGFVALQQFTRLSEVTFAVADSGRGLQAALRKTTSVRDDGHAITLAVRRHVTSTGEWGRGVGLNGLVRRTQSGGRLQLWSGQQSGVFRSGRIRPRLTRHATTFPGTVVQARIVKK